MNHTRVATVWLDGCSGCHMSLLDLDERVLDLADRIELVYSPLVDSKEFPEDVSITLVEGAVSTSDDAEKIRLIRERTTLLVSLGDCAVTANIPAMRNRFSVEAVLERAYVHNAAIGGQVPGIEVPRLLKRSRPVHEFVDVDRFLPGCPPPPEAIFNLMSELLDGRPTGSSIITRFGA
ncbi:MAG: NADP oxidoreductase [Desulfomonilaceae bacterium]|nr:NADP oxidoreductase [Desulfomonilaceae bacterium]